ncbi:MAG: hypothetical protein WBW33_06715, partial [Bryobacteraceae bacterium]
PNRRGFLHRTVSKPPRPRLSVALQPIPPRGRGASDTVLGNIGSYVRYPFSDMELRDRPLIAHE